MSGTKGMTKPPKFQIGDKVDKLKGYRFPGTVVGVFHTLPYGSPPARGLRYVVELDMYGVLEIFTGGDLIPREGGGDAICRRMGPIDPGKHFCTVRDGDSKAGRATLAGDTE